MCSRASWRRSRRRMRWADGRTHPVRKTPRLAGAFSFMRSRRAVSVAGQDAQVVGLQDRIDRGEERRRLAGLVASTATAVTVAATGLVGLGAAVDPGGAERRVLVALAIRSEDHTSELRSLMCHSYAVFCLTT